MSDSYEGGGGGQPRVPRGRAACGACTVAEASRAGQVWVSDELRAGGAGDADAVAAGPSFVCSFGDPEVICVDPEAKVARQPAPVPRGAGSDARPSPRFPKPWLWAQVVDLKRELRLRYGADAGDIAIVRATKAAPHPLPHPAAPSPSRNPADLPASGRFFVRVLLQSSAPDPPPRAPDRVSP